MDSSWQNTHSNPGTRWGPWARILELFRRRTVQEVQFRLWQRLQIVRVAKIILAVLLLKAMIRKWETRDAAFLPNDLENAISQPTVSVSERFLSIVIIGSTPVLLPSTLNYTSTVWHKRSCLSWWKPPHDIALSCTARTNFLLAKMLFTRTQNCSTEIRKQLWHIFRNFLLFHTLHTRLNF